MLAALATDGASETRTFAKAAIFSVFTYSGNESDFDKLISKLSVPEIRNLKEVVTKYAPKKESAPVKKEPLTPTTPTKSAEVKKPVIPAATTVFKYSYPRLTPYQPKKTESKVIATTTTTTPVKKVEEKPICNSHFFLN
jgi:hypothetical protein